MKTARFSDDEIRRYSRQLVLADVGGVGQERLRAATLRAWCEVEALYLAAAGIGTLEVPTSAIADAVRSLNPGVATRTLEMQPREISVEEAALSALRFASVSASARAGSGT